MRRDSVVRFIKKIGPVKTGLALASLLGCMALIGVNELSHHPTDEKGVTDNASNSAIEKTYKVTLQPIAGAKPIKFYYRDANQKVVEVETDSSTTFNLEVKESVLRKATSSKGIDMKKLISSFGLKNGTMIEVRVPYEIVSKDRKTRVPPNASALMDLKRYIELGDVEASGAWRESLGVSKQPDVSSDKTSDAFNRTLLNKGVRGSVAKPDKAKTDDQHPRVPLTGAASPDLSSSRFGERFLSSPTCSCNDQRGCRMTSYFGYRKQGRNTDGSLYSKDHLGLDISAHGRSGTPVVAAAGGKVVEIGYNKTAKSGLMVVIDHGKGYRTKYMHLGGFASGLNVGQAINRGEQLGTMGATGACTGPHLHFGVWFQGTAVDPQLHLMPRSDKQLSKSCGDLRAEIDGLPPTTAVASSSTTGTSSSRNSGRAGGAR